MKRLWSVLAVASLLGLAGCMQGDGKVERASVEFDGSGSGSQQDKSDCDTDGQLTGGGDIEDGQVTVTVMDAEGKEIFEQTYRDDVTLDSRSLDGKAGDWTIRAQRSGDDLVGDEFRGSYDFTLAC